MRMLDVPITRDPNKAIPANTLLAERVVAVPTGRTYGRNAQAGPLDGQPERRWYYQARTEKGIATFPNPREYNDELPPWEGA